MPYYISQVTTVLHTYNKSYFHLIQKFLQWHSYFSAISSFVSLGQNVVDHHTTDGTNGQQIKKSAESARKWVITRNSVEIPTFKQCEQKLRKNYNKITHFKIDNDLTNHLQVDLGRNSKVNSHWTCICSKKQKNALLERPAIKALKIIMLNTEVSRCDFVRSYPEIFEQLGKLKNNAALN